MNLQFDEEANALVIHLTDDDGFVSRTEEIDSGTLVDLDAAGNLVGIEVINPVREWPLHEITRRFSIPSDERQMLESLWSNPNSYPFTSGPATLA